MSELAEGATGKRLVVLDFLRGIAVLGIFVINIESFAYVDSFSAWRYGFDTDFDRDFRFWTYLFFQGKFFGMFALLFGVGFYLFLEKAGRYREHVADLYAHRMFWLFVFGVLHATLLWPGDILYHYAVCGLLLLPARSLRFWQLVACILALALLIGWQSVSSTSVLREKQAEYQHGLSVQPAERTPEHLETIEKWEQRWSARSPVPLDESSPRLGGYVENVLANVDATSVADGRIYYQGILFRTLLLMLAGILLYRLGVFHDYRSLNGYWPIAAGMLAFGLAANYSRHFAWTYEYFVPVTNYAKALAHDFSKEILGIAYVLVLNGLFQQYFHRFSFNPLVHVGRMALTNYLFQSVAAGFIFYGYGLGLHGSLGRSELWPLVLVVWIVQLVFSVAWLSRFQQGPMETLWRRLMHATALPGEHGVAASTPKPAGLPRDFPRKSESEKKEA